MSGRILNKNLLGLENFIGGIILAAGINESPTVRIYMAQRVSRNQGALAVVRPVAAASVAATIALRPLPPLLAPLPSSLAS